jgi:hypothetical protein
MRQIRNIRGSENRDEKSTQRLNPKINQEKLSKIKITGIKLNILGISSSK